MGASSGETWVIGDASDARVVKLARVVTQEDAGGIMGQVAARLGKAIEIGGAIEVDDRSDPGGDSVLIGRVGKGAEERGEVGSGRLPEGDDPIGVDPEFSGIASRPPHGLAEVVEGPWPTGRAGPGESVIDRDDYVAFPVSGRRPSCFEHRGGTTASTRRSSSRRGWPGWRGRRTPEAAGNELPGGT